MKTEKEIKDEIARLTELVLQNKSDMDLYGDDEIEYGVLRAEIFYYSDRIRLLGWVLEKGKED